MRSGKSKRNRRSRPPRRRTAGGGDAADDKTRVKELEKENKELKQQVLALQKRVEELEAERKAAASRARAQKLLRRLEKQGVSFGSDEEREKELARLAGLSDDAFAATEAAYEQLARVRAAAGKEEEDPGGGPDKGKAKAADEDPPMRSDAGVRPRDVDDRKTGLEERLRQGFMAAYRHRVALATGEPVQTN